MILDAVVPPRTSSLRDFSDLSEPSRAKLCLQNASGRISMLMIAADVNVDGDTNKRIAAIRRTTIGYPIMIAIMPHLDFLAFGWGNKDDSRRLTDQVRLRALHHTRCRSLPPGNHVDSCRHLQRWPGMQQCQLSHEMCQQERK